MNLLTFAFVQGQRKVKLGGTAPEVDGYGPLMVSPTDQEVLGWAGFVSVTGSRPLRLTTIVCYPVINRPIIEYSTVQKCLRFAEEATSEVGQAYTVTTFDLDYALKH